MSKEIGIQTIDGSHYGFPLDKVLKYDFEYTPSVLRIELKDGRIIEFTRQNIIFVGIFEEGDQ